MRQPYLTYRATGKLSTVFYLAFKTLNGNIFDPKHLIGRVWRLLNFLLWKKYLYFHSNKVGIVCSIFYCSSRKLCVCARAKWENGISREFLLLLPGDLPCPCYWVKCTRHPYIFRWETEMVLSLSGEQTFFSIKRRDRIGGQEEISSTLMGTIPL